MKTFVVIPCLNEQENLAATCASLGFGANVKPTSSKLVLVDNGSTDGTRAVMEQVRGDSAKGSVLLVTEPCRGYVPARRAGIAHVLACAQGERVPLNEVLVLQADADTIYLEGYVDAMQDAFAGQTGRMLEGCAVTNREFNARYPEFTGLCRVVDSAMEPLLANDEDQIVVDDKVSGFALLDYLSWGEHQDEVDAGGRQVLAETTRLFIRARRRDQALHISVPEASALPSRRKVIAQAPAYFASSGFPRDQAWRASWSDSVGTAAFLESPRQSAMIQKLIRSRQRHQLALFGVLPCVMRDSVRAEGTLSELTHRLRRLISRQTPGVIVGEILSLADQEDGPLDAAVEMWGARC